MCDFEKKVWKSLSQCELVPDSPNSMRAEKLRLGVAVSGGADSVSLLLALSNILSELSNSKSAVLYVITVNHNIRPAEESGGDAEFVKELCESLEKKCGFKIVCRIVELKPGAVNQEAEKRGGGIEEAARFLRYEAFNKFVEDNGLAALCLAHNKNDQLETVLMRFLQGSPVEAAAGIRMQRGSFIRPLLGISRSEIEEYVTSRDFCWRTDKTNYETEYLRNRIRHKLVPLLEEQFPGWQHAVLSGAQKAGEDAAFIQSYLDQIKIVPGKEISLKDFYDYPKAIQRRLLLSACNKAGEVARIPNVFINEILESDCDFTKRFGSIEISRKNEQLFIKKYTESNTDFVFSDIIEDIGTFMFPFGILNVFDYKEQNGKKTVSVSAGETDRESVVVENVSLPFYVRNYRTGDTVICADGSEKKIADIFSDWHVAPEKRTLIPVIQLLDEKSQRIKAVLAGFLGYKDWIVKL